VNIPRHFRRKKTVKKIPVETGNPSIKVSSAEYDPVTKSTSIAIVDEDKDAINFYMAEAPMKPTKVVVDEKGGLGIIITSKGKKKDLTMAHIHQPKDF